MSLTSTWFTTVAGLAIAAWFAVLCRRDMGLAITVFVAIAWNRFIPMFTLAGSRITEALFLVEVLPSVMFVIWWLDRVRAGRPPLVPSPVNRPLMLMIPVAVVSLVWTLGGHDPEVPAQHIKLTVSIGQILLFVWPVALYLVVANSIGDTARLRSIVRLVLAMAVPSLAIPVLPAAWRDYISWSIYFALIASPLSLASSFDTQSPVKKLGYWILAMSPIIYGLSIGKAYLYGSTAVSLAIVLFLKSRKLLVIGAVVGVGLFLLVTATSGSFVPAPLKELIDVERQQQSWGGRAGRLALATDALAIWARNPVFGVGPGNSWPYMHRYSVIDTPHNQYLNILVELGIVGLGCFLWFIVAGLRTGVGLLRDLRDPFHRTLVVGWLGAFGGILVGGLTGDFIFHSIRNGGLGMFPGYYLQWIFLGMVVCTGEIERREE